MKYRVAVWGPGVKSIALLPGMRSQLTGVPPSGSEAVVIQRYSISPVPPEGSVTFVMVAGRKSGLAHPRWSVPMVPPSVTLSSHSTKARSTPSASV